MTKILITGADGQLGSEFRCLQKIHAEYDFYFLGKQELDIKEEVSVRKFTRTQK